MKMITQLIKFHGFSKVDHMNSFGMNLTFKDWNFVLALVKGIGHVNIGRINLYKVIIKSVIGIFQISNFIIVGVNGNSGIIQFNSRWVELGAEVKYFSLSSIKLCK